MGGWLAAAAGAALLHRAIGGRCMLYSWLGMNSASADEIPPPTALQHRARFRQAMTVHRPVHEVFEFFSHLDCAAGLLPWVRQYSETEGGGSRWVMDSGQLCEAQIVAWEPNRRIEWRSPATTAYQHAGSLDLAPAPGDRGTEVTLTFSYEPPMGVVGAALSKLSGQSPQTLARQAMRLTKQFLEAGEAISGAGTSGRQKQQPLSPPPAEPPGMSAQERRQDQRVEEASMESFPASDPPGYTHRGS